MKEVILSQAEEIRKSLLACINECYPDQQTDISVKEVTINRIFGKNLKNDVVIITLEVIIESINQNYRNNYFELRFSELDDWIEEIKALAKTPFKYAKDDLLIIVDEDEKTYQYCKVLDKVRELRFRFGYADIDTLRNRNFYKVHCFNGIEKNISESQLFQYASS